MIAPIERRSLDRRALDKAIKELVREIARKAAHDAGVAALANKI